MYLDELELKAAEQFRVWRRARVWMGVTFTFVAVLSTGTVVFLAVCG